MAKFQVVSTKPMSGISKASQRPYSMLIVSGILSNDDGTIELGEVVFMERTGHPMPTHLVPGKSYTPVISGSARQGKLQFEITELNELAVAATPISKAA
jgi:hypothetical protein